MFGLEFGESVEFLAVVFLALIIALQGNAARKRKPAPAPVYEIECPNKIEGIWALLERLENSCSRVEASTSETRTLLPDVRENIKLHKARDEDGVPRWYSRDQGRDILGLLGKIMARIDALEKELEIRNRINGNGGSRR